MIVIGYPGIGKSAICGKSRGIIDLDSYFFHKPLETLNGSDYGWEKRYCDVAIDLHKQGYVVCISSHEEVQLYLEVNREKFNNRAILIYPAYTEDMKEKWLSRLKNRYYESRKVDSSPHWCVEKNYKALEHVKQCFALDLLRMTNSPLYKYEIREIPYDLNDIIEQCQTNFKYGGCWF